MKYYENPTSFGKIPENSFAKVNHQLVKIVCGFNGRVELVTSNRGEVRRLRDHLATLRDNSPDDWRRWDEVDSYYTSLCVAGSQ